MAVITVDTRQKAGKHDLKHDWLVAHGLTLVRCKLSTGDYGTDTSNVVVDTKQNMAELVQNVTRDHARFARECERAKTDGYRLVVLVEEQVRDPWMWTNQYCKQCPYRRRVCCHPRQRGEACYQIGKAKPIQGDTLAKTLRSFTANYGVFFEFCDKQDTGKRICELLGVSYE